jgi:hypothetical protein
MSNIDNCADCGKRFGFTESIFRKTNGLWICEDCNIKQIQENDNKDKKIADLEAKLAEKEERINWLVEAEFDRKWAKKYVEMRRKEDPMLCLPDSDEVYEKYFELKQQLAEKDETIKELKQRLKDTIKIYSDDFVEKDKELKELRFKARNIFPLVENLEEKVNQDKISFAVEQLRRVKKLCKEKFDWWENSEWEGDIYDKSDVSNAYFDIEANIDEQIGQLTHQHEDKGE